MDKKREFSLVFHRREGAVISEPHGNTRKKERKMPFKEEENGFGRFQGKGNRCSFLTDEEV